MRAREAGMTLLEIMIVLAILGSLMAFLIGPMLMKMWREAEIKNTRILINQFYFPGWIVRINGQTVPRSVLEAELTPDGRMTVPVHVTTACTLDAFYGGPPGAWPRFLLIALGTAVFFAANRCWSTFPPVLSAGRLARPASAPRRRSG